MAKLSFDSSQWLFDASAEPVLIVDATRERIDRVNPAGAALLRTTRAALEGSLLLEGFDAAGAAPLNDALAIARTAGVAGPVAVRAKSGAPMSLRLSLLRAGPDSYFLVHPVARVDPGIAAPKDARPSRVFDAVDGAAEGFLITDPGFLLEYANRGFLDMVQLDSQDDVRGAPLQRWLRLSKAHLARLGEQLLNRRSVEDLTTTLDTRQDCARGVEVRAVAVPDGAWTCWGFCVRELALLH